MEDVRPYTLKLLCCTEIREPTEIIVILDGDIKVYRCIILPDLGLKYILSDGARKSQRCEVQKKNRPSGSRRASARRADPP